jgi:CP family cyanate transporter-like MFS transporter
VARRALLLAGLVLIAANLRASLTAVGPLTGQIRAGTGISGGVAGLITTLPLLAFGVASPVVPRLARRLGVDRALLASLLLLAAAILVRSAGPVPALLVGTTLLGLAIAIANVLMPSLVKRDFPERAGLVTGLYSSIMGGLAALAVGLAVPLADRTGLGWRGSLASWSLLALLGVAVWLPQVRRAEPPDSPAPGDPPAPGDGTAATRPLWRYPLAWQVTLFMGLQSLAFYVTVSWLPEILHERGGLDPAEAGWALSAVQLIGVVASLVVPVLAVRRAGQRLPAVAAASLYLAGAAGLLAGVGPLALWCGLLGLGQGAAFGLALTLFALRAPDARRAADLSGMAQSVGYLLAAGGPVLFGLLHDRTGGWTAPLAVLVAVSLALIPAGLGAGRPALVAGDPSGGLVGSGGRVLRHGHGRHP